MNNDKIKVVIVIKGGMLQNVYSSQSLDIELIDYDYIESAEYDSEDELDKAIANAESIVDNAADTFVEQMF